MRKNRRNHHHQHRQHDHGHLNQRDFARQFTGSFFNIERALSTRIFTDLT
ncbi:hypothetical protein [Vibrio vulnificus YJ016]|uniref:Uncharacterized protein n=1 Tax=Vibrio vulnificus (strain YJ016) TaxID=196600 RepID=Q7MK05_VIBVY|nr:hypothetical protein [Vibrio vulnificus YJ016]